MKAMASNLSLAVLVISLQASATQAQEDAGGFRPFNRPGVRSAERDGADAPNLIEQVLQAPRSLWDKTVAMFQPDEETPNRRRPAVKTELNDTTNPFWDPLGLFIGEEPGAGPYTVREWMRGRRVGRQR